MFFYETLIKPSKMKGKKIVVLAIAAAAAYSLTKAKVDEAVSKFIYTFKSVRFRLGDGTKVTWENFDKVLSIVTITLEYNFENKNDFAINLISFDGKLNYGYQNIATITLSKPINVPPLTKVTGKAEIKTTTGKIAKDLTQWLQDGKQFQKFWVEGVLILEVAGLKTPYPVKEVIEAAYRPF
jgi:hypothetical protein